MRQICTAVAIGLVLLAARAWAGPHVICDPPPAGEIITGYTATPGTLSPDGQMFTPSGEAIALAAPLYWDLDGVIPGQYEIRAMGSMIYTGSDGSQVTVPGVSDPIVWSFTASPGPPGPTGARLAP